ncbi:MAG: hypothetical protein ACREXM_04930 [Gammaproteobacteria bacterium]
MPRHSPFTIRLSRHERDVLVDRARKYTLALHKFRLMPISRSFQSRQVMQQFLLDRLIG